jgi:hypothetical protein
MFVDNYSCVYSTRFLALNAWEDQVESISQHWTPTALSLSDSKQSPISLVFAKSWRSSQAIFEADLKRKPSTG